VTTHPSTAVPRLVVLAPESFRGRQIELVADYTTVGREPTCDVRLDDPHVSRTHAALQRRDGAVYVQDLGSSGGTFVNGSPARGTELRQGDVVTFAIVQARFEAAPPVAAETAAMPTQVGPWAGGGVPGGAVPGGGAPGGMSPAQGGMIPAPAGPAPARDAAPPPAAAMPPPARMAAPVRAERPEPNPTEVRKPEPVRYEIGQQYGQQISNVGRDQYNAHVQQVIQRRESFLREIAGTKTKARWLVWLGLLLFVAGFAMFAAADLNFLKQIASDIQSNGTPPPSDPFGRPIFGIPSGLLGWAIGAVGALMLVIGIVLHIVATSRRRRVEREYPLPMPWPPNGPAGRAR
jgi:FHA domain